MSKQNWGEILKYTAILAAGFVAVRVALKTQDAMKQGVKALDAAKKAVEETVKTDLNPASDKNLVYRGVNYGLGFGDQSENSIGTAARGLWEKISGQDPMKKMEEMDRKRQETNAASQAAMAASQEDFRKTELGTSGAVSDALDSAVADTAMAQYGLVNQSGTPDTAGPIFNWGY